MKPQIRELARQGAIEALGSWKQLGCEYVSIVDGVPRPWKSKSVAQIFAEAQARGVEVLSLDNRDHVSNILAAICDYIERSLTLSQTQAESRKLGAVFARGGTA